MLRATDILNRVSEQGEIDGEPVSVEGPPADEPKADDSDEPQFQHRDIPKFDNSAVPKENGMIPVFVFETLMNKKLRKLLLKREVGFEIDAIPNYREVSLETPEGSDYHTIISSDGDKVKGQILFCTDAELAILDDWEDQYQRVPVYMESGRKAWVYILKVSKMKDFGTNVDVDLNDDDLKLISMYLKEEFVVMRVCGTRSVNEGRDLGVSR